MVLVEQREVPYFGANSFFLSELNAFVFLLGRQQIVITCRK